MKSEVTKRSISIAGHKTSVTLEETFWQGLREIAASQRRTVSNLVDEIDVNRQDGNLSSHIRMFVLEHYRSRGDVNSVR